MLLFNPTTSSASRACNGSPTACSVAAMRMLPTIGARSVKTNAAGQPTRYLRGIPYRGIPFQMLTSIDEDTYVPETASASKAVKTDSFLKALALSGVTAVGAAAVAVYLEHIPGAPCTISGSCMEISDTMKGLLVGSHLFNFLLAPATMYLFYDKMEELKGDRARSPFTLMLGLSFIMVASMSEMGSHMAQGWHFTESFSIQNLGYYFFLNTGLSLWALGLRLNKGFDAVTTNTPFLSASRSLQGALTRSKGVNMGDVLDFFLLSAAPASLGLYLLGAAELHSHASVYALMAASSSILTFRFWQLLQTKWVALFPLFAVGANLSLIALLANSETNATLNPLFHLLHDAAGVNMGIGAIAALMYLSPAADSAENPSP